MTVDLFIPCLTDQAAPETARAAATVLRGLGVKIRFDRRQTCCGQALFNAGHRVEAARLAERFISIFEDAEAVVAPGGSCVSMVSLHYAELDLHPTMRQAWESLRNRLHEFTSFLVDRLGIVETGARFPFKVAYHPSCHLTRDLGIVEQPMKLLEAVDGLELVGGDLPSECCGFGGAFSAKYPALSRRIADRRAAAFAATGAAFVTGCDDSCLGQLEHAFHRQSLKPRAIHIAEILASEGRKKR